MGFFLFTNSLEHISWAETTHLVLLNNHCFPLSLYSGFPRFYLMSYGHESSGSSWFWQSLRLYSLDRRAADIFQAISEFSFVWCFSHGYWVWEIMYPSYQGHICCLFFELQQILHPKAPQTDRCFLKSVQLPDGYFLP